MTLTLTFLGSGSAFTTGCSNFHSNCLIEVDKKRLLIDAGSDVRLSLHHAELSYLDVDGVYITHTHGDHIGGLEWFALATYFDANYHKKPLLLSHSTILDNLWSHSLSGGLSTLNEFQASLTTFFDVQAIIENDRFTWQAIPFELVKTIHYFNDGQLMPCYGLLFSYNNTRIFYTADTQFQPDRLMKAYEEADIIFHDCETAPKPTGVHAHYNDLCKLSADIKKKMWLYHYNDGDLPAAVADGFKGFVQRGQQFIF